MHNIGSMLLLQGIILGSVYALISLGFNVIYRTTGVLNFAQGEFVMVGGMAAAWAATTPGWPMPYAILFGAGAATLVGVLLDVLAVQPVRRAGPVIQIIVTIGASIMLRGVAALVWGTDPVHLPELATGAHIIAGTEIDTQSLLVVGVAAVCMLLLTLFFRFTTAGRAMKACADNAEAARLCGVRISRMSMLAFGMSALLGGIGGILLTPRLSMSFTGGTMLGLKGFSAAVLGGLGNPVGGVVGGVLLGVLEQYSCWYSSLYKDTLALAIVVLVLLIRPRGLFSK